MLYDIYAGMGGSFGGAEFQKTEDYRSHQEAKREAYEMAVEIYQSYEGMSGILSWTECKEALEEGYGEVTDEEVNDYYKEEVEGWIEYYAVEHDNENPPEED